MNDAPLWTDLLYWAGKSTKIIVKKLARNDSSWADDPQKHQNGLYIPAEIRNANFFPTLRNINTAKPHIFETPLKTLWPSSGGMLKDSNLKHYSNKGSEMHFTGVPKPEFADLTPASLLVGGRLDEAVGGASYWFMAIDSASEEAELLETILDLDADFHFGLFDPFAFASKNADETEILIAELKTAIAAGTLKDFIAVASKLPPPESLARNAQALYLQNSRLESLDPYMMDCPGDAIMRISRDIEFALYKRAELRHRAAEVIRIITRCETDLISAVVKGFPELDATFLSASQHRKSRAGRSFEQHISRFLRDGRISFEEQVVTGGRRPDFVLPNLLTLSATTIHPNEALVLSAKTTLRERWKQVTSEKFHADLFLATVDDRVSAEAIADMDRHGINLVVPESLKDSKETCYKAKQNVITFRQFFREEIDRKRPSLRTHAVSPLR